MSTSHVLLGILSLGPGHGYDLKRRHDQRFPQAKPLAFGQVYATLTRLARDGYARPGHAEPGDGPDRTAYAITDDGVGALDAWLTAVAAPAPHLGNEMYSKVVIALLTGGDEDHRSRSYLAAQRAAHIARMRELTRTKTDPATPVGDVVAADYAIVHLDADLRWIDATKARLGELARALHTSGDTP